MPARVEVAEHLELEEIKAGYRGCSDPVEKIHWLLIKQLKEGTVGSVAEAAKHCGLTASWACRMVKRYNALGSEGLKDRRRENGAESLLGPEDVAALMEAIKGPSADGGLWTSPKVAVWIGKRLGREVTAGTAWAMMRRLGLKTKVPRPRHQKAASKEEQAAYKKSSEKTSRGSAKSTQIKQSSSGPKTKRA